MNPLRRLRVDQPWRVASVLGAVAILATLAVMAARARPADVARAGLGNTALAAPHGFPVEGTRQDGSAPAQVGASIDASRRNAIVEAAGRVAGAVVSVNTIRRERVRPRSVWEGMFLPPNAQRRSSSLGSGFVIDADGIVLTNDHVISGADEIMVTLPDGRDFPAELVGTDEVTDVAVLRVRGDDLPVAPLGTSQGLIIGEWAIAIGNPFGNLFSNTEPTVTVGVVSAIGRHIVPEGDERGIYLGMIQTDASINPGNSGGPLVNALGQVIGVNSSIFSRSGGSEGLGFAIPIDRALRVATDLLQHGEVRRAWFGLEVEPAQADAWGRARGVRVARVLARSPAANAGIAPGDNVVAAGGVRLTAPLDFQNVLLDVRAGDTISLVLGDGERTVRVGAEPLPSVQAERVTLLEDMQLISVTPAVQAERGLASPAGALVVDISERLRDQIGFQPGDVIVRINNVVIRSAEDVDRVFEQIRGRRLFLRITFERAGRLNMREFRWG